MKTVTNYAEKKAKQFLNLLQGYTKGIRITAILILLLMGVSNAWAAYYYRGNQNSWGATKMTASADGFYEYFAAKSHANNGNQNQMFKVSTSSSSWEYNNGYMKSGFNGTNITNMGSWDSDNICMYHDKDYYILVYKPNTTVNNTTKPIVCAATYLPDNRECTVYFVNKDSWNSVNAYGWYYQKSTDGPNNVWPGKAMENTGKTYNGKQIWSYTYPQTYDKAIFNNGSSKTSDLTLGTTNKGKMYDYPNSQWIDYNYDVKVTFNANGHGTAPTAKTVLKGGKVSAPTAPTATGYTFGGWYKESGCTNAFDFNTAIDADITLYAKWTENTYTVTITNDGHGTTDPSGEQSNVGEVTGLSIKATPAANYEFVNWTITSGSGSFGSATSASTTFKPTSAATIQANFRSTATNSLTVVAGANIESVAGPTNPVTLGNTYDIEATPKTGYTFSTWTADPAANATFGSSTTANTNVTVKNGSVTVTASAVETMSTLTTSNSYTAGDPGYATPTKSVDEIGIATTASITAAESEAGYRFAGWTLTNCIRTDGGEANAVTITVRSNGNGGEANVTANYELLPPTTVYFKPIDAWKDKDIRFAVYGWHNSTFAWIDMTSVDCNGDYYKAEIPAIYTQMKFVSFPTDKANSWDNDINKTGDLTIPEAVDDKVLYDMASTNITHLYLKPNSNWVKDNAWFAAYLCNGTDAASWYQLGKVEDNIYGVEIGSDKLNSTKNKNVIFCRMNPSQKNLDWGQKWNQTGDLPMPTNGTNMCTIPSEVWDCGTNVTWSTYYDDSKWTTYTAPTYDVTINIVGEGTIDINGTEYAESTTISAIELNNLLSIGDISCDVSNWRFASAMIKIGNNVEENITSNSQTAPICGPTTITVTFEANVLEVSFDLQGKSHDPIESQHVERDGLAVEPKANDIEGYLFGGWYKEAACKNKFDFSQPITENTIIYAKWISHSDCIFFKNNLKWANVYIYTFTDNAWWSNVNDPGVHPKENKKEHGKMIQVGQSDIYYYVLTEGNNFSYIAFSSANMSNNNAFYTNAGIYRGDHDVDMTLFIPDAKQTAETHNKTKYYNKGVWMKYNSAQSGYKLNIVNSSTQVEFTTDKVGGYVFTATMELSGKPNMDITNLQPERKYANNGTMTQKNCTNWQMSEWTWAEQSTWYVQTTSAGDYVFTLDLSDGQVRVSVQYPLAVGDYRLAYQENDGENNTKFHPAQYIRKVTEDTKLDTISFFVNKEGQSPSIVLQQCTAVNNTGVGTWSTRATEPIDLNKIEQSGVYNVALQQTNAGSHQATILCNDETYPQAYTGNYYIRTDAANGGWKNYKKETNQMEYTNLNADYDYYYCKWFNNPTGNVRFVVANDYSECVSDTMKTDLFLGGEQLLGESANVRYAWSSKTNTTSRAYLAGSGSNTEYLTINGTNIYTNAASPKPISGKSKFVDQNNWVYALDIKAKNGAVIDVKAVYKGKESTFIDDKNIMSIQDDKYYTLRVIYNFKTNNIVSSWLLQDVQQDMALSADIMMIRNGQNAPNQLALNGHSISGDPKTVYGVMQFNISDITDSEKSIWERGLYWISFPFDVNLVDVFGLGEYGTAWIIQYYDGEERAQKGWFQETATFWKYVMPEDRKNFVLRKNIGYGLALDIEAIEWPHGIEQQNLYFPSKEKIDIIASELTSTTVEVPAHTCTIERDDRKTKDSHWNVIGVPSYADAENVVSPDGLKFLYEWNPQDNTLSVSEATTHTFKAMHSYMVQFAGTIDWEQKKIVPAALAAKAPAKESTLLQLTLTEGGKQLDQTYVELTNEATAAFDMNMDLTKFFNTGHANIYSCIQTVPVAANMLPVQSVQVPLGIQVVKEGTYTIALPASVDAALVTLIDNQTQTHTCLNTSDYTVTLPAGTYENRFFLAVEPQRVVTSNPANKQDTAPTVKFIKDGQLYILHQGVIYDAQGRR